VHFPMASVKQGQAACACPCTAARLSYQSTSPDHRHLFCLQAIGIVVGGAFTA